MATYTTYLGLKVNSSTDQFALADFSNNWSILDASPGVYVCTSATRPNWSAAQAGRLIFMADWECLSFWNGTAWLDCRDAAPVYAAGSYINSTIAHNTSASFTVISLTLPRSCSLVVMLTGTYLCPAGAYQSLWQRVLVDGVGATANQLGGYREQLRFSPTIGFADQAGMCATSFQVIPGVAAGQHTVGVGVDVGNVSNQSVTLLGAKALAFIGVTNSGNAL